MRVTVFGTGYVGLVTGTCLAEVGHQVVCVDIDAAKVDGLNRGVIPIYEPGLEAMVLANHGAGRLSFTTDAAAAIAHGEVIFIAVGTPPDEDGSADLQYVLTVARTIGGHLGRRAVIVNKSTVPVGTADKVRAAIAAELAARGTDIAFEVVSNPEFLKEGDAVKDCMRPDRIVIGTDSAAGAGDDEAPVRAVQPQPRAHRRHGRALGRADQVRGERDAGDQDQFHERNGQHRRTRRRRYRDGPPRHRFRSAHRLFLHLPRRRLWRLVFPQGRAGAGAHGAAARLPRADPGSGGGGQRSAEAQVCSSWSSGISAATCARARPSRSGAWRSSPTPTTCARPRAAPCWRSCGTRARRCRRYDPEAMRRGPAHLR